MAIQLKIQRGKIARAQKVVIYGSEGIGKTTLASKFPDPLFIDTEGGSSHLDVARIECPKEWPVLIETVEEIAKQNVCKTLVIDTADWLEQIAVNHLLQTYRMKSIEAFGYGKGYTYLAELMSDLLATLNKVIDSGKHVVLLAHAKMRKQELPDEMGAFDRWELKLSRQVAPLIKEWGDLVLFLNYKTIVVNTDSTHKAQGGKRVIFTTHHPCWDAKNRHGLDDELPLDYSSIAFIFGDTPKFTTTLTYEEQLNKLMSENNITETQIRGLLSSSSSYKADAPLSDYAEKVVSKWDVIVNKLNMEI